MSDLSNPASGAREDGERYIAAILDLLGERDPLDVLRGTPAWCEGMARGASPERLAAPEAPGKWSVAQVLDHLADTEVVWGWRLRKVLAEDRPTLTGFDQDLWARRLGYGDGSWETALALFGALRRSHLSLLERAGPDALERVGIHEERGEESVRHMMRLYAGHDLAHRRQIGRILGEG